MTGYARPRCFGGVFCLPKNRMIPRFFRDPADRFPALVPPPLRVPKKVTIQHIDSRFFLRYNRRASCMHCNFFEWKRSDYFMDKQSEDVPLGPIRVGVFEVVNDADPDWPERHVFRLFIHKMITSLPLKKLQCIQLARLL